MSYEKADQAIAINDYFSKQAANAGSKPGGVVVIQQRDLAEDSPGAATLEDPELVSGHAYEDPNSKVQTTL